MTYNPRKTKIVCTLGPSTESAEKIRALMEAGMNVARLNFSHGDHEGHGKMLRTLREISRDMGKEIGILQDLGGPKIRLEEVPIIQKQIIRMARQSGKPVITVTQMLRSMIDNPRPTRAEASDAANAILDGTDALMLSDETAIGEYPVAAVRILDRIARATERHLHERSFFIETLSEPLSTTASAIGRSACFLAEDLRASAIVAGTSSGSTARPGLDAEPSNRAATDIVLGSRAGAGRPLHGYGRDLRSGRIMGTGARHRGPRRPIGGHRWRTRGNPRDHKPD